MLGLSSNGKVLYEWFWEPILPFMSISPYNDRMLEKSVNARVASTRYPGIVATDKAATMHVVFDTAVTAPGWFEAESLVHLPTDVIPCTSHHGVHFTSMLR